MFKTRPHHLPSHWQSTRKLTLCLLLIWFFLTFGVIYFARELATITLFGWPLSFYMAAQGLALIFLVLVAVYTRQMQTIDEHNQDAG